jgi:hypothetical protein
VAWGVSGVEWGKHGEVRGGSQMHCTHVDQELKAH